MAQADSVPSSSRQSITGESAHQSTNLPAVKLPAVMKPADRPYLTGDLHARVIIGNDKAPLVPPWREKRGDEPEGLLKCRYYGANAGQASVTSNIRALFYVNAAFFLGRLLRRIVLILLRFVSRTRRLSNSGPDKVSSNQLVPSRPQERLR
jgi:hypothetical protein